MTANPGRTLCFGAALRLLRDVRVAIPGREKKIEEGKDA
jgi:hypothetical protein